MEIGSCEGWQYRNIVEVAKLFRSLTVRAWRTYEPWRGIRLTILRAARTENQTNPRRYYLTNSNCTSISIENQAIGRRDELTT